MKSYHWVDNETLDIEVRDDEYYPGSVSAMPEPGRVTATGE